MQENNINHDFGADLKSINSFLLHKKRPNSPIVITIMQSHAPGNRAHGVLWEFQCVKKTPTTQGYRSKLANRKCIWLIFIFFILDFQEKKRKKENFNGLCALLWSDKAHIHYDHHWKRTTLLKTFRDILCIIYDIIHLGVSWIVRVGGVQRVETHK